MSILLSAAEWIITKTSPDTVFYDNKNFAWVDDSFDHEAWNWSYDLRVVLFIDFERPLPFWVAPMNRFMIWLIGASPFIQKILTNIEAERKNG